MAKEISTTPTTTNWLYILLIFNKKVDGTQTSWNIFPHRKKNDDILYYNEKLIKEIYKSKILLKDNIKNNINDNNDIINHKKYNYQKKILPKINKNISLSSFGYKFTYRTYTR